MTSKKHRKKSVLERLYWVEGYSIAEIAEKLGVSASTVYRNMERLGVERRTSDNERHPQVKTTKKGYERLQTKVDNNVETVRIHRLVAVAEHGFDTVAGRVIHHKNGIPWDNRPANIEVLTQSKHAEVHNKRRFE